MFTVDAFTNEPFAGNPAAVCVLQNKTLEDDLMQKIAQEMNLAETAYVVPLNETHEGGPLFGLRWMTPEVEVNLCGHATLASGHILFTQYPFLMKDSPIAYFKTRSGILSVQKQKDGKLQLNFPQGKPTKVSLSQDALNGLKENLPLSSESEIVDVWHCATNRKLVVRLSAAHSMKCDQMKPNFLGLQKINFGDLTVKGIIVTTNGLKGEGKLEKYDFISRYFAPWVGIPEDPVTGSAHTVLAVYWAQQLNKPKMLAFQASRRGGEMTVELVNDRVLMEGVAVTVMKAEMTV